MEALYFDYNATTPLDPEVLECMLPSLREEFGNPSSIHSQGRAARVKVDEAREQVAGLIQAHPAEIVFTSGGTESDNLAILGAVRSLKDKGRHMITCQIEHPAVLNSCRQLEQEGMTVEYLPVNAEGRIDPQAVADAIRPDTVLVSIQHANSEIGTLQDIAAIGQVARDRQVLFHTDAVQSAGKIPINVKELPVDLLSISAHKMYGPKGVGALFIRRGTPPIEALLFGGGQEKKRRGGTENVAGIVGFGKAAVLAGSRMDTDAPAMQKLRDRLRADLAKNISGTYFHTPIENVLPNTLSVAFDEVDGESLMIRLDLSGVSVSTGTACSSGVTLPSEVLTALGVSEDSIQSTLRLSLGRLTRAEEVNRVVAALSDAVGEIRSRKSVLT